VALRLKKNSQYGVEGDYWVIDNFSYHKTTNVVEVILRMYSSEEAKNLAKSQGIKLQPLATQNFIFQANQFHPQIHPIVEAYQLIKRKGYQPPTEKVGMEGDKNFVPAKEAVKGEFYDAEDVLDDGQVEFDYDAFIAHLSAGGN